MKHFLLTRLNDYYPGFFVGQNSEFGLQSDWLRYRIGILNKFTVPSIECQTDLDFTWIIKCHPNTPVWARDLLKSDMFIACYDDVSRFANVAEQSKNMFINPIRKIASDKWIITTRMDSDDMLSKDHVRLVKENIQENKWFDFSKGIVKTGSDFYFHEKHGVSMFCSYLECQHSLKTVYWKEHNNIQDHECNINTTDLGWIHHHHEMNISLIKKNKYQHKVEFKDIFMLMGKFPSVFKNIFF